jgi:lipoprotein-releasing system permease protein
MNTIVSFLAKKYLVFRSKNKSVAFMSRLCFLGILIGTFSLMMTLIITVGFEKTIHNKMQGINAQAIIQSIGNQLDYENIKEILEKDFDYCLQGVSARKTRQMIVNQKDSQQVIFLTGIDPMNESLVTNITEKMFIKDTGGKEVSLEKLLQKNSIVLGYKIAQQIGCKVGDTITVMLPESASKRKVSLRSEKMSVAGVFKVGLEEYDNNVAFASLNYVQVLFDEEGVDSVLVNFRPDKECFSSLVKYYFNRLKKFFSGKSHEEELIEKLRNRLPELQVYSWKDLYPALVSSLRLEKYVMFFIIALISFVAAMNMISLLFMQIQQKRRDIAIYKVMGMPNNMIKKIFLKIGMRITFFASFIGLLCAFIVGFLLKRYPFIELPDVYYISYLPAYLSWEMFLIVFVVVMLIGFFASKIPLQNIDRVNVVEVLRQE